MDEQAIREHAQAHADALLAGDIGNAAEEMTKELRSNLGPIVGHAADAPRARQGHHHHVTAEPMSRFRRREY
jgi:hypothetical protein